MPEQDFEVLFKETPAHVRANANLPGQFVYTTTSMTSHSDLVQRNRTMFEEAFPGYDPSHVHETCVKTPRAYRGMYAWFWTCGHWNWHDFGIPEDGDPVGTFITPYLQISRAEGMKGSEQVTRGFMGNRPGPVIEGVGESPNLYPQSTPGQAQVIIQNGVQDYKRAKKGFLRRR